MHGLPKAAAVGFAPEHFGDIREVGPALGFLEVHAENCMGAGGLPTPDSRRCGRIMRSADPLPEAGRGDPRSEGDHLMFGVIRQMNRLPARIADDLMSLALRIFPAMVFFQSCRTKVEGLFSIRDSAWFLFEHEYALPPIPSNIAAVIATTAEQVLTVLMILGRGTLLSALALPGMTAVIQTFVHPDARVTHGLRAGALLAVVVRRPGALTLDRLRGLGGQTVRGATSVVRAV